MKSKILQFLQAVERAYPPNPGRHHALMACRYGSDEKGWTDKLALQVKVGCRFQAFFLADDDFERPFEIVVAELVDLIKAEAPPSTQTSAAAGSFTKD